MLTFASIQQCRGLRPARCLGEYHFVRVPCCQCSPGIVGGPLPVLGEDRDRTEKGGTHRNITLRGHRLSDLQRFQVGLKRFLREQKGLVHDPKRQQVDNEKDAEGQRAGCFGAFECVGERFLVGADFYEPPR